MNKTAEVLLTEMSQEQLIKHIDRLEQKIHELTNYTGEEIVAENERLQAVVYRQGWVLDRICESLHYCGIETPNDDHIWRGVSQLALDWKSARQAKVGGQ